MPARARSVGVSMVTSRPPRRIVPLVGSSAPATHFSSVLLPEPLGPMRPWNSFSPTIRSTPLRAASRPKTLVSPRTSSSGIVRSCVGVARRKRTTTEAADPLLLGHHKPEQPGGPKQGDDEQQQPEDNGPDLRKAIGEPEACDFDGDDADDGADQRANAAEQGIEHDLR